MVLVEPLLDPAVEAQALGRVNRIGQLCDTWVHRFVARAPACWQPRPRCMFCCCTSCSFLIVLCLVIGNLSALADDWECLVAPTSFLLHELQICLFAAQAKSCSSFSPGLFARNKAGLLRCVASKVSAHRAVTCNVCACPDCSVVELRTGERECRGECAPPVRVASGRHGPFRHCTASLRGGAVRAVCPRDYWLEACDMRHGSGGNASF